MGIVDGESVAIEISLTGGGKVLGCSGSKQNCIERVINEVMIWPCAQRCHLHITQCEIGRVEGVGEVVAMARRQRERETRDRERERRERRERDERQRDRERDCNLQIDVFQQCSAESTALFLPRVAPGEVKFGGRVEVLLGGIFRPAEQIRAVEPACKNKEMKK